MRIRASCLALTAAVLSAACDDDEFADPTPTLEQIVANLRNDLEERGYEVAVGDRRLFRIEDCVFLLQTLGNCLGNNPAAPYVIPSVPLWDDEYVDPLMVDVLGPTPGNTWSTFRMDEREALVVLAHMPPPGAYFGIQSYVWSREGQIDTTDPVYQEVADDPFMQSILFMETPNPERVLTFASVGDSNNHVVIERQSGAAFDRDRYFVVTPDAVMERAVTDALIRSGVPTRDHVFEERVSPDFARLGLGESADDLMTLIRYALPDDEAAGDAWRRELPLFVLRVRDRDRTRATEPYAVPVREARTAVSELALEDDVDALVTAVRQAWGQQGAPTAELESLLLKVGLRGDLCLDRPMNCLGDTSDADYQISATASLDDGEVLALVGTLGTQTGNATYTSLSVNWIPPLVGSVNVSHRELTGSASAFSGVVDETDRLYVYYFARDCTGLDNCVRITDTQIPPGGALKLIQRNYVVPGSTRGPDPLLVVNPRLIVLDGRNRPGDD